MIRFNSEADGYSPDRRRFMQCRRVGAGCVLAPRTLCFRDFFLNYSGKNPKELWLNNLDISKTKKLLARWHFWKTLLSISRKDAKSLRKSFKFYIFAAWREKKASHSQTVLWLEKLCVSSCDFAKHPTCICRVVDSKSKCTSYLITNPKGLLWNQKDL